MQLPGHSLKGMAKEVEEVGYTIKRTGSVANKFHNNEQEREQGCQREDALKDQRDSARVSLK